KKIARQRFCKQPEIQKPEVVSGLGFWLYKGRRGGSHSAFCSKIAEIKKFVSKGRLFKTNIL
ncbi:MAG: hypothetical protein K6B40_00005, partial [Firmicutes bacterium]|nr:hypothetical protein [Bacillota bacterium]